MEGQSQRGVREAEEAVLPVLYAARNGAGRVTSSTLAGSLGTATEAGAGCDAGSTAAAAGASKRKAS